MKRYISLFVMLLPSVFLFVSIVVIIVLSYLGVIA